MFFIQTALVEHATTDDVTKSVTLPDILQEIPVQLTSNKKIDKIITKPKKLMNIIGRFGCRQCHTSERYRNWK